MSKAHATENGENDIYDRDRLRNALSWIRTVFSILRVSAQETKEIV